MTRPEQCTECTTVVGWRHILACGLQNAEAALELTVMAGPLRPLANRVSKAPSKSNNCLMSKKKTKNDSSQEAAAPSRSTSVVQWRSKNFQEQSPKVLPCNDETGTNAMNRGDLALPPSYSAVKNLSSDFFFLFSRYFYRFILVKAARCCSG